MGNKKFKKMTTRTWGLLLIFYMASREILTQTNTGTIRKKQARENQRRLMQQLLIRPNETRVVPFS
jgi:hypothetical protein